jgi:hypothetical protein
MAILPRFRSIPLKLNSDVSFIVSAFVWKTLRTFEREVLPYLGDGGECFPVAVRLLMTAATSRQ